MILHPEDTLTFGKNKGYTLAEIYHYLPSYIEWLVMYTTGFIIDAKEFEALTKPVNFYYIRREHSGSVKQMMNINADLLREFNFKFSDEYLRIIQLKKKGQYQTPLYQQQAKSKLIPLSELLRNNKQ